MCLTLKKIKNYNAFPQNLLSMKIIINVDYQIADILKYVRILHLVK